MTFRRWRRVGNSPASGDGRRSFAAAGVALAVLASGCSNDAWTEVEPDPQAVALVAEHGGPSAASADPSTPNRLSVLLTAATAEVGEPYEWGADGPSVWDCSSFVRHAYGEVGIRMPRTARAQRDWMAEGHGVPVKAGQERPGDLVFWDDYLGPDEIGHVAMVWDPDESSTIEARTPETGFYRYQSAQDHSRFEVWRVAELAEPVASG